MKINQKAVREIASEECFCQRCHAPLDPAAVVWLDMNWRTSRYSDEPLPEGDSQGCFPFGPDCAKAVLAAGGECKEIRDQRVCGVVIRRRAQKVVRCCSEPQVLGGRCENCGTWAEDVQ